MIQYRNKLEAAINKGYGDGIVNLSPKDYKSSMGRTKKDMDLNQ